MKHVLALLLGTLIAGTLSADDWPRWRGPNLNGISAEAAWLDRWPDKGPPVAWKASVGVGFATVSVSKGRVCTTGHQNGKDTIWCFDEATGKVLWKHSYVADLGDLYFDGGTTATPTFHDGQVYSLSRWGDLFCLNAATGKVVWSRNLQKNPGVRLPTWGLSGAPLVHEDLLLLNVGKAGMAVDRATGKTVWASATDDMAGYSTPLPFRRGDDWFVWVSSESAYAAVNARTGKSLWSIRWLTQYGVNAADPILAGEHVAISSGYGKGAALFKLGDKQPAEVWRNRSLRNQMNPSVLLDGFLYGVDGDTGSEATLRCVDWKTGEVRWTEEGIGSGALTAADGKLIVLAERGELIVAKATPDRFTPMARANVIDGRCWTVPVLANGRIWCRSAAGDLVCLDVRRK